MTESHLPRLALTPGEPGGIGPDITLMLASRAQPFALIAIADPDLLSTRANRLGIEVELLEYQADQPTTPHQAGQLPVIPVKMAVPATPGQLNPKNALYVLETLQVACSSIRRGELDALTTGPVHKGIINEAGIPFTGHTEYLAEQCGGTPVMMLTAEPLRVALATTHLPLTKVSQAITQNSLEQTIRTLHQDLSQRFNLANPRILVCGLNPHAGENGHLGREEIDVIQPVIDKLSHQGLNLTGPLPADTVFTPRYLDHADAVLAMYHDQGLPVLKHVGFGRAVNITLGIPIIRTSVDHGTALELAGTGKAEIGSYQAACDMASQLVQNQRQYE